MRDIIFVSQDDWANVGALFAAAGRKVGMDCLSVAARHHIFEYIERSYIYQTIPEVQELADKFRAVVIMHAYPLWQAWLHLKKRDWQKWGVFHSWGGMSKVDGGKTATAHSIFNKIVDVTLIQTWECLGLGGVNEQWIIPPVDIDYIKPAFSKPNDPLILYHKARHDKGSDAINAVMSAWQSKCNYISSNDTKPWTEHLKRMSECDIVLEQLTHSWGMTALEAAALGKIVITSFAIKDIYEQEMDCKCPFIVANSPAELSEQVGIVLSFSPEKIMELQRTTRDWVVKYHSYEPIGNKFRNLFL